MVEDGFGNRPIFFYIGEYMSFKLFKQIIKRMVAVFMAQALGVLGAGSLVGIGVLESSLLAGFLGMAHVMEMLARKYMDDGKLTLKEVNEAFNTQPIKK
tara:strand:+ start:384 stop:680 length:297 start_codon:yes stop_codon:yes gene_type:complete